MATSVPAKLYKSGVPLADMEPGGYQFRTDPHGVVIWFFRTPLGGAVLQIKDALVPTVNGKPEVQINRWVLSGDVWRKA
jgi:hypothetical protein